MSEVIGHSQGGAPCAQLCCSDRLVDALKIDGLVMLGSESPMERLPPTEGLKKPAETANFPSLPKLSKFLVFSQELAHEATVLSPLFTAWRALFTQGSILDCDFAAAYILAYAAMRSKPGKWCKGALKHVPSSNGHAGKLDVHFRAGCAQIQEFPDLIRLLGPDTLTRWLGHAYSERLVLEIFQTVRINGINKNKGDYVNQSLLAWGRAERPLELMFRIPSPMQVLRRQACGLRVVTFFTTESELSRTHTAPLEYMDHGLTEHSRDPLHFACHDLQHIEHFCAPDLYGEQVGFFKCLLRLNEGNPKEFFEQQGFGQECPRLWKELEYCISDMNTYSTHLLKYLRQKWILADGGPATSRSDSFTRGWNALLVSFGVEIDSALARAMVAVSDLPRRPRDASIAGWSEVDGELVRDFFRQQSRREADLNLGAESTTNQALKIEDVH